MDRKCVIVGGMHRSGTSALGGILHACGINMGASLRPPAADNVKGFFEDTEVLRLNKQILRSFGTTRLWDSILLDDGWQDQRSVRDLVPAAVSLIRREYGESPLIGMKDPRLCRIIPFWRHALSLAGYDAVVVIIHRDPAEVAASLAKRNGFEEGPCVLLWAQHVLDLERDSRDLRRCVVSFDALLSNPGAVITKIQSDLGVTFPASFQGSHVVANGFLSRSLRHHRGQLDAIGPFPDAIGRLARLMADLASGSRRDDDSARAELDRIRHERDFWLQPLASGRRPYRQQPHLYLDAGGGFDYEASVPPNHASRDGSLIVADFTISREGVTGVRLDPVEGRSVRMAPVSAEASYDKGRGTLDWNAAVSNRAYQADDWWVFRTMDPMIVWRVPKAVRSLRLTYHLEYLTPDELQLELTSIGEENSRLKASLDNIREEREAPKQTFAAVRLSRTRPIVRLAQAPYRVARRIGRKVRTFFHRGR